MFGAGSFTVGRFLAYSAIPPFLLGDCQMAQVHADPEQLKRFANNLTAFNRELAEMIVRMRDNFASLGETWRDQEHEKFANEFTQTMRVLERFIRMSDDHIPMLRRKAEHLDNFLHRR